MLFAFRRLRTPALSSVVTVNNPSMHRVGTNSGTASFVVGYVATRRTANTVTPGLNSSPYNKRLQAQGLFSRDKRAGAFRRLAFVSVLQHWQIC